MHTLQRSAKRGAIVGANRLIWRTDKSSGSLTLHYGQSETILARVVRDATRPSMFRIQFANGNLSDMANITWAKDAAVAVALRSLNAKPQETAEEGPPIRRKPMQVLGPASKSGGTP